MGIYRRSGEREGRNVGGGRRDNGTGRKEAKVK